MPYILVNDRFLVAEEYEELVPYGNGAPPGVGPGARSLIAAFRYVDAGLASLEARQPTVVATEPCLPVPRAAWIATRILVPTASATGGGTALPTCRYEAVFRP